MHRSTQTNIKPHLVNETIVKTTVPYWVYVWHNLFAQKLAVFGDYICTKRKRDICMHAQDVIYVSLIP